MQASKQVQAVIAGHVAALRKASRIGNEGAKEKAAAALGGSV